MTYDAHLQANIRADKVVIPRNKVEAALKALNAHFESEPPWMDLKTALGEHEIPGNYVVEQGFVLSNWTGRLSEGPDQFVIEDIVKLLAPFLESGGEFEFSAEDFSENPETEGEVLEFNRGFYRFRDGKVFSVVNNGMRISQEDKDYLADLADRIYKTHQIQSTIHATTFYDSTKLREIVAGCGEVETELE